MERVIFPKKSAFYMLMCGGGVLAFVLLAIYPLHRNLSVLDHEISKVEAEIKQQQVLFPVYQQLLEKTRVKRPEGLPFPPKRPLSEKELDQIASILNGLAVKSRLKLSGVSSEIFSMAKGKNYLRVGLTAEGDFFNFHGFLVQLGQLPYIEHFEQFQIQAAKHAKQFQMIIWLAQK